MDRIIKITLGIFLVLLVIFVSITSYGLLVNYLYKSSLTSTYTYSCTIQTDSPITNVTLFLPLPVSPSGASPVVEQAGKVDITGLPDNWKAVIYGADQATFLKITGPVIGSSGVPASITLNLNVKTQDIINTRSPMEDGVIFRPVESARKTVCPLVSNVSYVPECSQYTTTVFASYESTESGTVTIHAYLDGVNAWKIFEPDYNEYRNSVDATFSGNTIGWTKASASLESGMGSYAVPSV